MYGRSISVIFFSVQFKVFFMLMLKISIEANGNILFILEEYQTKCNVILISIQFLKKYMLLVIGEFYF